MLAPDCSGVAGIDPAERILKDRGGSIVAGAAAVAGIDPAERILKDHRQAHGLELVLVAGIDPAERILKGGVRQSCGRCVAVAGIDPAERILKVRLLSSLPPEWRWHESIRQSGYGKSTVVGGLPAATMVAGIDPAERILKDRAQSRRPGVAPCGMNRSGRADTERAMQQTWR